MPHTRRRYAVVGTGHRAQTFVQAITTTHRDVAELVALCDTNPTRGRYHRDRIAELGGHPPPVYAAESFEGMLDAERPDAVIVSTMDRTHHAYLIPALQHGCDAVTEKPLTTDADRCGAILSAIRETGRNVTVTFNYRYRPSNARVKELLASGAIGDVQAVHFEWLLDTRHGADFYRRWHRDKRNSGGLLVHKAAHHFDLVNWWLASRPELVFALGDLRFYGRRNAAARGEAHDYARGTSAAAGDDPFALDLRHDPQLRDLYLRAEADDGYQRDRNAFGDGISIEDTMAVLVRYATGAVLTYSLVSYSPWEGYRISFTGTGGRLEVDITERAMVPTATTPVDPGATPVAPAGDAHREGLRRSRILLQPLWEAAEEIPVEDEEGGHGGGDARLLDHLFRGVGDDPLGQAAHALDGVQSVLVGAAANRSMATGGPVRPQQLLDAAG